MAPGTPSILDSSEPDLEAVMLDGTYKFYATYFLKMKHSFLRIMNRSNNLHGQSDRYWHKHYLE